MKKTKLGLAILSLIILSQSSGEFFKPIGADPMPQRIPSYRPIIIPPIIAIQTPENHSICNVNSIDLIFNVTAPQSVNASHSRIYRVYYKADWRQTGDYVYVQNLSNNEHFPFKEFTLTLSNITDGQHSIQITADGTVTCPDGNYSFEFSSMGETSSDFTIESSTPNLTAADSIVEIPLQLITTILVIMTVVAVGLGLLVYFKKRKHVDAKQVK
jgi:hypothetical protein